MAFTTIELSPGLTGTDRKRARDNAPLAVTARRPYLQLLSRAGFVDAGRRDVTGEYRETVKRWWVEYDRHREAVAAAAGEEYLDDRLQTWAGALSVIDRGWLQRWLYWTRRP